MPKFTALGMTQQTLNDPNINILASLLEEQQTDTISQEHNKKYRSTHFCKRLRKKPLTGFETWVQRITVVLNTPDYAHVSPWLFKLITLLLISTITAKTLYQHNTHYNHNTEEIVDV